MKRIRHLRISNGAEAIVNSALHTVVLNSDGTGTVNVSAAPTAAAIPTLYIASAPGFSQSLSPTRGGPFLAESTIEAFEKAAMRDLWLRGGMVRTLRGPVIDDEKDELPDAAARSNYVLAFDHAGKPVMSTRRDLLESSIAAAFTPALTQLADNISAVQLGTGAVARPVQDKLRETISIKDFGAKGDGATDDTAAIQATIDAAHATGRGSVFVPNGEFVVYGTLYMKKGVTLYGANPVGEYYPDQPDVAKGATLIKPNLPGAQAGPVVEMAWASGLLNLAIRNEKLAGATTGTVRVGPMATTTNITYCSIINCHIASLRTGDLSGRTTSRGLFFPGSQSGFGRYFNRVANVTVTECDIAIGLQQQCNANQFTNIITRECHRHYELNGTGSECIENSFTGLGLFSSSGSLSPDPVGFVLQENVKNCNFISFNTEMYGQAYDIHPTAVDNRFLGQTNEAVPSYIPAGNFDLGNFDVGTNNQQLRIMTLPTRTTGDRNIFMPAARFERFARVSGTLPMMANATGNLSTGSSSRIIARFGAGFFTKANKPTFRCKLRIYADGNAPIGMDFVEVEFVYRTTATGTAAGKLCVTRVDKKADYITGLYFITSVSSPANGFAIGLVGGNSTSVPFDSITVAMEIEALTFDSNVEPVSELIEVSFAAETPTAADITDSISLLTVADTVV